MKVEDALDFVWLSAAVLSGLCVLATVGTALGPVFNGRLLALGTLPVLAGFWGAVAWGLKHRRRWAWWLSIVLFGSVTCALLPLALWCWISTLREGAGDRHGVGREGQWIFNIGFPLGVVFGLGPVRTLWRARHLFHSHPPK